ncbi:hypothetical protein K457DRAFT_1828390 [Linnemannia elongata AG-77]|uniref:Uncharacterized protein n=1 Tax=Linnemannia elongata AG-77 TaxID=1314771 RepID=A0A197K8Y9_9FUNG|nr:hypothetical protein K457DRAFT_1828390 [Linnemannia elongata AG-77]
MEKGEEEERTERGWDLIDEYFSYSIPMDLQTIQPTSWDSPGQIDPFHWTAARLSNHFHVK